MLIFVWSQDTLQRSYLVNTLSAQGQKAVGVDNYVALRKQLKAHHSKVVIIIFDVNTLRHVNQIESLHGHAPLAALIAIHVNQQEETHVKLLESGADDYLVQPFSDEILIAKCKALHRQYKRLLNYRTQVKQKNIETHLGIVFNFSNYRVQKDQQYTNLSKVQFLLLYHLCTHANNVHSRESLSAMVWQGKTSAGRQIDNLVLVLRKILPEAFELCIKTVYGEGYMLFKQPK